MVKVSKLVSDKSSSHRGGFGEFGGDNQGLIDRTFRERIVLAGVALDSGSSGDIEDSLEELARLVDTAGADTVARVVQSREMPDRATYVGRGKADEIRLVSDSYDADTVVFDNDLTPAQQGNLEAILKRSALDRTAVILDIFAQNASSPEGKAQVELAQLLYRLPRLRRSGRVFSQQGGGIGTRGPGETQLEVDRRRVMQRVSRLEEDLRRFRKHRATQSKARKQTSNLRISIVGYTNAGKSTLLNRLTDAGVLVEDRLFATLDTTTRRLKLPGGEAVYLTDTVGFVRRLPHQLVEAFKATLDVVVDADLLLHVVDASDTNPESCITAVHSVLREIGADHIPELFVINKADIASSAAARLMSHKSSSVVVSARTGKGIDGLLEEIGSILRQSTHFIELMVPFDKGDVRAMAHREGQVVDESVGSEGWILKVRLDEGSAGRLSSFKLDGGSAIEINEPLESE